MIHKAAQSSNNNAISQMTQRRLVFITLDARPQTEPRDTHNVRPARFP